MNGGPGFANLNTGEVVPQGHPSGLPAGSTYIGGGPERAGREGGLKFDGGKAPIWRGFIKYFPRAIEAVANVSGFGFSKYESWGGWVSVPEGLDRYQDAEARHWIEEAKGEPRAGDSQLLHAAHRAWGAMAHLELLLRDEERKQNTCLECEPGPPPAGEPHGAGKLVTVQGHDDLHE